MKSNYQAPYVEVMEFNCKDEVVTASLPGYEDNKTESGM